MCSCYNKEKPQKVTRIVASISVIIPVYNTAKYVDECMESVLSQTFTDIEIMLVDDGSTDGVSPALCDDYGRRDNRVRVIHKENGGLQSAWIAGLVESTANYIAFLDSDDWVDADMFEKLYAFVDSSFAQSEIIAGNYIVEKAGERRKETQSLAPGMYTGGALDEIRHNLMGNEIRPITMSRCMKLISRKLLLDNIRYCDPTITMGEDVNIMLPCLCDAKRLVILEEAHFYHYRLVAASMGHAYNSRLLANLELTDRTFRDILREKGITNADEQMDREFVIMLFVVMKNELRCSDSDTVSRVKEIFRRPDIRKKVQETKIDVNGKANRLLYLGMKHPNALTVSVMKTIIGYYDKKTN